MACCMSKQWHVLNHDVRLFNIHVSRKSANGNMVAGVFDVGKVGNASNVNEHAWLSQAKFH